MTNTLIEKEQIVKWNLKSTQTLIQTASYLYLWISGLERSNEYDLASKKKILNYSSLDNKISIVMYSYIFP